MEDTRKVFIFAKHVQEKCDGKLPRTKDCAELEGWDHESAWAERVQVGQWWYSFAIRNDGARKKRVVKTAARHDDTATQEALQYLAKCEKRDDSRLDVEGDSRRVRILAKHVAENCDGKLPRNKDCAELEGWDHENAGAERVRVGDWWYRFTITNDGARKKRVVEAAARDDDEAKTREALQYLANCERRNHGLLDVEGDSRRVRILAKHVQENCDGKLPRKTDCAELEGWEDESAGAARVQVGRWWFDFTTTNDGARKKRVVEAAARDDDEAKTQEALQYLATCERRDDSRLDVEGDSRRVRILAKHVAENCDGNLPRTADCAELEGWDHENAGAERVRVGNWWYNLTIRDDGVRKKRVVEAAARDDDEAKTREALQYLANCERRNEKKRSR
jgi:hypothetical protein